MSKNHEYLDHVLLKELNRLGWDSVSGPTRRAGYYDLRSPLIRLAVGVFGTTLLGWVLLRFFDTAVKHWGATVPVAVVRGQVENILFAYGVGVIGFLLGYWHADSKLNKRLAKDLREMRKISESASLEINRAACGEKIDFAGLHERLQLHQPFEAYSGTKWKRILIRFLIAGLIFIGIPYFGSAPDALWTMKYFAAALGIILGLSAAESRIGEEAKLRIIPLVRWLGTVQRFCLGPFETRTDG